MRLRERAERALQAAHAAPQRRVLARVSHLLKGKIHMTSTQWVGEDGILMSRPSKGAQLHRANDAIFVDVVSKLPYRGSAPPRTSRCTPSRSTTKRGTSSARVRSKRLARGCVNCGIILNIAECGIAFSTKSSLAAHQRSHERDGSYRDEHNNVVAWLHNPCFICHQNYSNCISPNCSLFLWLLLI